jgi:DNA-binding transcriptional ArsR family regulator
MAKSHAHFVAFRRVLECFALLGHPLRVVIFQRLARRPRTAGELARELPVSRIAVVQHLKRLEAAGLVRGTRRSRHRVYRIDPAGLDPLSNWIEAQKQLARAGQAC